jgi:uncharacterized protein
VSSSWRGAYPALTRDPGLDRDLYFSSYVQTYLQRDVRDLARVGDETAFLRFVRACAARTVQLLNVAELARDADVAPNTAKHWLSVLETWILVEILRSWWHQGKQALFHFYRDKDKKEIDLLIVRNGVIHPLEFKKAASLGRDSVRHFGTLARLDRPIGPGGVICLAESSLPLTEDVVTIPVGAV